MFILGEAGHLKYPDTPQNFSILRFEGNLFINL